MKAMEIFREELRKIASRRIVWASLILVLVFVTLRLWVVQTEYQVKIDGVHYKGVKAIDKDRELAREYEGILTMKTVQNIHGRFGFSYYDGEKDHFNGNYSSEFITERMTNFFELEENDPSKIHFLEGEEWDRNAAPLLDGSVTFGYAYGWEDLRETYTLVIILLSVIFIIGFTPVFAEEYTLRTADLLLATEHGKKRGIWLKIWVAVSFAAGTFCALSLYMILLYLSIFGTDGLEASSILLNGVSKGIGPETIGGLLLLMFGLGLSGLMLLTGITLAVSAASRNSFMAVVVSGILYAVPYVWMKVLAPMWILGPVLTKGMNHFMVSMPMYLPMNWGFTFTGDQMGIHAGIAGIVLAACLAAAYRIHRNYQG